MAKGDNFKVLNTVNIKPGKLVFDEKFMGRSQLVSDEEVTVLADNIKEYGQQQPIQVRQVEGTDQFVPLLGRTRSRAGVKIAEGYKNLKGKDIPADPNFTIRAEVVDMTDEEAFIRNVVEQTHRNNTTAWDNAVNQERMRKELNMSDVAIAKAYGYNGGAMVSRYKKLLDMPAFIQEAVHKGELTAYAAFELAKADDVRKANAWEAVWSKAKSDTDDHDYKDGEPHTNIGLSQIGVALKEWRTEEKAKNAPAPVPTDTEGNPIPQVDAEGNPVVSTPVETQPSDNGTPVKATALNVKQIKDGLKEMGGDLRTPPKLKTACELFLAVVTGESTFKDLGAYLMAEFGETPLEIPPATNERVEEGGKTIEELNAENQKPKTRGRKAKVKA